MIAAPISMQRRVIKPFSARRKFAVSPISVISIRQVKPMFPTPTTMVTVESFGIVAAVFIEYSLRMIDAVMLLKTKPIC